MPTGSDLTLRPATAPGEDRNADKLKLMQAAGILRPATAPGEDRNLDGAHVLALHPGLTAPGHRAGRGSQRGPTNTRRE